MSDLRHPSAGSSGLLLLLFAAAVLAAGLAVAGIEQQGRSDWLRPSLLVAPSLVVGLVLLVAAGLALHRSAGRRALMFVLAFGVFAVTVGAAAWHANGIRNAIVERQASHQSDLAQLKAQTIEKWLFERSLGPNILAASIGQIDNDPDTLSETEKQVIGVLFSEYMAADPERMDVTLFRPDGGVVLHLGRAEQPSEAELQAVKAFTAGTAKRQYVELRGDTPDGKGLRLAYLEAVPQAKAGNAKPAVLVSVLDPGTLLFRQLDERMVGDRTSETMVVHKQGDTLAYIKRSAGLARTGAPEAAVTTWLAGMRRIVDGQTEAAHDYRGVPVLAAAEPVKGLPWYVVVKTDRAEAMRPFDDQISSAVILVVASILGGGLMLWLLWSTRRTA